MDAFRITILYFLAYQVPLSLCRFPVGTTLSVLFSMALSFIGHIRINAADMTDKIYFAL
jgi:hypothetical protein